MDKFSVQDEGIKRKSGLKALLMEVGVIVVLIVTLLLVLVYFNIINLDSFFPSQKEQPAKTITQTISPVPTETLVTSKSRSFKKITPIQSLKTSNAIHFSKNTTEYEGKIIEIDLKGGKTFNVKTGTDVEYKALIKFNAGDNNIVLTTFFSEAGLPKIDVFSRDRADKLIPIGLSDLKVNDRIIINLENSNTDEYPNDLIKATITKVL